MKEKIINYKPKNAKLLRIKIETTDDGRIKKIRIYGDFFIYPEEKIEDIESSLIGLPISDLDFIRETLNKIVNEKHIEMIGISPDTIVEAISRIKEL
ncbi:MAG: lipoate protein ligase C-terminal domain-containing protein [Candidatus Asgardarchaeia archaeon]|nr:MAG: biotin--protein ligase [Candidatus Asgardarchaeum californiense]